MTRTNFYPLNRQILIRTVIFSLLTLVLSHSPQTQAAFSALDDFNTDQAAITLTAVADVGNTVSSTLSGAGILGGERDIRITMTQGAIGGNRMSATVSTGIFSLGCEPTIAGTTEIQWDGADGDALTLDPTGLGGFDLTGGNLQDAFQLRVASDDFPVGLTLAVYTDGANFSTATINLPGLITNQDFIIPFTSFTTGGGSGANFTNVGAVTLSVPEVVDLDLSLDFLGTISLADVTKSDAIAVDSDGDGQVDPGDTVQYTMVITNPADVAQDATNIIFRDTP